MNEVDHRAVLSIRGEAERSVPPDQVAIQWWVSTVGESKSAAMAAVTNLISVVTAGLSEISGEVLTVDTTRAALTWSTQSIHTEREYTHNKVTGDHGPTGRHHATANSVVILRNFDLLDRVEAVLTSHDTTDIQAVQWTVDHDNPSWALVRADAIRAALMKGRDYATALGGALVSVDHIADPGLLGGDAPMRARLADRSFALAAGTEASGEASMNPVPQAVTAVIEARLTARIAPLPAG